MSEEQKVDLVCAYVRAKKKALEAKEEAFEFQKKELRAKEEALEAFKEFQKRELIAKEAFQQEKSEADLRSYALESIVKHGSSIMSEEQKAGLVRDYVKMSGLDRGATVNDEPPSKKQRLALQERDAAPPPQPETPPRTPPAPAAVPSPADAPTPSTGAPPANAAAALADALQQNPARRAFPEPHILCVTEKGETLPLGQEEDQKFLASLRRFIYVRTQLELGVGMYRIPRMGKEDVNLP